MAQSPIARLGVGTYRRLFAFFASEFAMPVPSAASRMAMVKHSSDRRMSKTETTGHVHQAGPAPAFDGGGSQVDRLVAVPGSRPYRNIIVIEGS